MSQEVQFRGSRSYSVGASIPSCSRYSAQNVFNPFPDKSPNAGDVGERDSEYTPGGFNGIFLNGRLR